MVKDQLMVLNVPEVAHKRSLLHATPLARALVEGTYQLAPNPDTGCVPLAQKTR
jgi:hypothetical protein